MAISITRAKAKESSGIEKAKKAPSSNSQTTSRSTRDSIKPSTRSSSYDHKAKTSEKQIPSYLKPTISSRFESQCHSFRHLKNDATTQKPTPNRRPSSEKPASPSTSSKRKELSSSRLHKPLVAPGPPRKTPPLVRSTSSPTPLKSTLSSKPISKRTSKTPRDAKPQPTSFTKGVNSNKTAPTTKKAGDAPANSTKTPENAYATAEKSRLEIVPQVIDQESGVLKVDDDERQEVEKRSEVPARYGNEPEHEHEQHYKLKSDQPHIHADDERVIPSPSEDKPISASVVEKANGDLQEEETKDEHGVEEGTGQEESNNGRPPEVQSATDGDDEVKEKEKGGGVIEDDESENNDEGKTLEEKEEGERGISEDKIDGDELVSKIEVEGVMLESKPAKQDAGKESQPYKNVIVESASKLLETRKNKVRALAGAFQSVIDNQSSSK